MTERNTFRPLRFAADAVIGLALFLLVAGLLAGTRYGEVRLTDLYPSQALAAYVPSTDAGTRWAQPTSQIVPLAMVTSYPGQVFRNTDRTTAFIVLSAVFSLLFAGNVALFRHLRAQYAPAGRRSKKVFKI